MQYNHPWIDAYWEPNQQINTYNSCLALVDLEANSESKLVCVNFTDSRAYLKVNLLSNNNLIFQDMMF